MFDQTGILPPEGLIIEAVTPLTPAGDLDAASLTRLVERVAAAADGLLVGGPEAGEGLALPPQVRLELLGRSLVEVKGRLPIFFGITGSTPEETRALALAVPEVMSRHDYQGQVFLADLPLWYHSNRGLPQFYKKLLQEAKLPLMVLNLPEVLRRRAFLFKHRNIRTQVLKKLTEIPAITGVIYQGELRRFLNYHLAAVARPAFAFYEADECRFLTRPGAWGVVSAGAQLYPEAWRQVSRACLHPEEVGEDFAARHHLWEESSRLVNLAGLYHPAPAPLVKAALAAQGILASDVTAPGTKPAPPPQRQKLLDFSPAIP
jgi:dihydrodipicolinate synthase/N-acetylneuraminate lyase|uniref:Dihydrodipicolinate synthase family protein n=1 Tax=Desulfobacca acetoxidans TaxID=60893 RepID=A0A7V6DPJ4_9BACT